MAKLNGNKITIATILAIIMFAGGIIWAMATQSNRIDTVYFTVEAMKPEVKINTEARKEIQTDIKWIKGSLVRIEDKLP